MSKWRGAIYISGVLLGKLQGLGLSFIFLLSTNAQALTNSQPAYHDSNAFNVWMTIEGVEKGESYHALCNGSFIADDLIVTAAHCLSGSYDMEDKITVHVGKYKTFKGSAANVTQYRTSLDIIKSKKIYFPNSVDAKIRAGKMHSDRAINSYSDIALIELERPVDKSKVEVQIINYVTPAEHKKILSNSAKYTYIALTTNLIAVNTTDYKRYAELIGVKFNSIMNRAYGISMLNSIYPNATEEGDSGAPVLVNVSGQWKLFALVKGKKRDYLSSVVQDLAKTAINFTPPVNIFTPVANKMCELLTSAGRSCAQ